MAFDQGKPRLSPAILTVWALVNDSGPQTEVGSGPFVALIRDLHGKMFRRLFKWLFGNPTANLPVAPAKDVSPGSETPSEQPEQQSALFENRATRRPPPAAGPRSDPGTSIQLSGLETDRFAPLTQDSALEATRADDWQNAYWDPMNEIPPEDLPRIKVIDGTMVGLGLISSEELNHIHEVGRQMSVFRQQASYAEGAAARAVSESRKRRELQRAQKKREAAERKEKRKNEIAARRSTEIDFLGRGVSKGLSDQRSNVEKLRQLGLPVLSKAADVASALGMTISQLRWLSYHSEAPTTIHYFLFEIPRKSGGSRLIAAPHQKLAAAQQWIQSNLLTHLELHQAAHGFVPGKSVHSNAEPHVDSAIVLNTDLTDFFPTITFYRVEGMFRSLGYSPAVSTILGLLCTECPRRKMSFQGQTYFAATGVRSLPQGACTSPAISNVICRRLDRRLSGMADKLGWAYTRYADDLTWSSHSIPDQSIGYVLSRVQHIVQDEGFELNESKTRVLRRSTRQTVTGIVVNDKTTVPRTTVRRIRAILHNAKRTGLAAQNNMDHPHFELWLQGMIAWISMVNPDQGRKLRSAYLELQPGN